MTLYLNLCLGAVTNNSASVQVVLQDSASNKLIAKARYTEQAPHTIRAKARAYLTHAASAARSAVQRLQTAAEHTLQRSDSTALGQADSDNIPMPDIRHKATASLTSAGVTVRAAAHRLHVAADNVLHSSPADDGQTPSDKAKTLEDDTEVQLQASRVLVVQGC